MSFNFRIGRSTVCNILKKTSEIIWDVLQPQYVKAPSSEEEWMGISDQFQHIWNFPNCIGAIDGKHVVMQAPVNAGLSFLSIKAHYRFIVVDVGDACHHSNGGVLSNSSFGQALDDKTLHISRGRPLPGTSSPMLPYVIVGDEAFPFKENMMRPYPGKNLDEPECIYNYRLSRARRIIENSCGILAARWRIFRKPIIADPNKVVLYTKAAIALHNYLRTTESSVYCPPGFVDGEDGSGNVIVGTWRAECDNTAGGLEPLGQVGGNR